MKAVPEPDASAVDAPPPPLDAAPDAMIPLGPWSTPAAVPGAGNADDPTLSSSALELYFGSGNPKQLYVMTRPSPAGAWGTPTKLDATFNDPRVAQESPRLSPDDRTIYFGRNGDIYTATRPAVGGAWSTPVTVAGVDTGNYEKWLAVCDASHYMVSRANGANGQDLFEGVLGDAGTAVTALNSGASEISTYLSPDCKTMFFASNRSGQTQLYTSTRATITDPWAAPTLVDTFGAATDNEDGWMSPDTRTFVFASVRGGSANKDIYISTR
jgi:hypothetical protein